MAWPETPDQWSGKMTDIVVRSKEHRRVTPFNMRFLHGQKHEHNIFSPDVEHDWRVAGGHRTCTACFRQEFRVSDGSWHPMPNTEWSTEDIMFTILEDQKGDGIK